MALIPGKTVSEAFNALLPDNSAAPAAVIVVVEATVTMRLTGPEIDPNNRVLIPSEANVHRDGVVLVVFDVPLSAPLGADINAELIVEIDGQKRFMTQDVGTVGESLDEVKETLQRIEQKLTSQQVASGLSACCTRPILLNTNETVNVNRDLSIDPTGKVIRFYAWNRSKQLLIDVPAISEISGFSASVVSPLDPFTGRWAVRDTITGQVYGYGRIVVVPAPHGSS